MVKAVLYYDDKTNCEFESHLLHQCQYMAHRVQSVLTAEPKLRKQIAHWGYNWRRSECPVPQTVIECYMTVDRGQQVALTL